MSFIYSIPSEVRSYWYLTAYLLLVLFSEFMVPYIYIYIYLVLLYLFMPNNVL